MTDTPKYIEVMARGMATAADGASLAWWYRVPVDHPAKILYLSRATAAHASLLEAGYVVMNADGMADTLMSAAENLRSADRTESRAEAAFRLAYKLDTYRTMIEAANVSKEISK